ncbi:ABC transporter permease [Fulvivirga ulvae]|uniref:ABC transporter permease n=1 Tax=Fulvivirga ulvae TaxID=2904245 RepID=UPI001F34BD57|nr:ABC transporter permease [Fulvivirga ulvae]UII29560.1 ABC transporter permease [Fulvivirga ulvae]
MDILRLSLKNIIARPLSAVLSLVLLTVGVGIISLLLQVNQHVRHQMDNNLSGIDMVVGAKGSPLQLILSAVYHVDMPTGNIPLAEAEKLSRHPLIASGIPLAYGDSFEGYRIVGTNYDYPKNYDAQTASGTLWKHPFEVTVGATVAANLQLKPGDTFTGTHGLSEGGEGHEDHPYKVAGIFSYTHSVLDNLILTSLESVWEAHNEDDHRHHENENHKEEADPEITAMLLSFRNPLGMVQLPRLVNERTSMQAAVPAYELNRLFGLMGVGIDTINAIAIAIIAIAGLSMFISLWNALKDRKYEMALMRTYGASRWQVVWVVLQEALLLTWIGFACGLLFSRVGLSILSSHTQASYHYELSGWQFLPEEWVLLFIATGIGLVAAFIPAIQTFYINISKTLADA